MAEFYRDVFEPCASHTKNAGDRNHYLTDARDGWSSCRGHHD